MEIVTGKFLENNFGIELFKWLGLNVENISFYD